VISFAVIGRFWISHHRMYENLIGYDLGIIWVNLLWLLTIVFLPFPTELIATDGSSNPVTTALYVGTMLATSLVGSWQQWLLRRRPALQAEAVRGTLRILPALVSTALMAVAFATTVLVPQVGLFALFLLVLTGPAQRLIDRLLHLGRYAPAEPPAASPAGTDGD
ncbi:MAG: TMEM175 family protein, partial [Herbiconiux sp.]|nr:TMEM175 family protein [Herbiconiux sp.]